MFRRPWTVAKIGGINIRIDASWIFIALIVVWSLSAGVFPRTLADRSVGTYVALGIAGAIGLFLSVVLHELGHAMLARRFGVPVKSVTLFLFGGVAEMSEEPLSPRAEFLVAIVGPVVSVGLGLLFLASGAAVQAFTGAQVVGALLAFLGSINLILAVFNMLPAFPLDGGRVLRSILWAWRGNLYRATRIAAGFGSFFALVLALAGASFIIFGGQLGGLWWILLALFLHGAARASVRQLVVSRALREHSVSEVMDAEVRPVGPDLSLEELVDQHLHRRSMVPVVESDELLGYVGTEQVKRVPRARWGETATHEVMVRRSESNTIGENESALEAMKRMQRSGLTRLLVAAGSRLSGTVAQSSLAGAADLHAGEAKAKA